MLQFAKTKTTFENIYCYTVIINVEYKCGFGPSEEIMVF